MTDENDFCEDRQNGGYSDGGTSHCFHALSSVSDVCCWCADLFLSDSSLEPDHGPHAPEIPEFRPANPGLEEGIPKRDCGHPTACTLISKENTPYCGWCADLTLQKIEARKAEAEARFEGRHGPRSNYRGELP